MSPHATADPHQSSAGDQARSPLLAATEGLAEALAPVDAPARAWGELVRRKLGSGTLKDVLSGAPLGHPLHPVMTDVVIGCFSSANILDLVAGEGSERSARVLIAAGLAAAGPTVASGWSDWADSNVDPEVRRIGIVHALANATGTVLYGASLRARIGGRRGTGRLLGLAGASVLGLGGYLGGHLTYAKAVGVNGSALRDGVDARSFGT